MTPLEKAQEMARRNNENVAVNAAYRRRRSLRFLLGGKSNASKASDDADWRAAEGEARQVRAVGFFLPGT